MSENRKTVKFVRVGLITLATLCVLGILVYAWYMHTPYYAIQQVGTSIAHRDAKTFYRYCDSNAVVNSLTDQLFFQPAMHTHGMSDFQNYVACGAIVMTKQRMDRALMTAVERMFTPVPNVSFDEGSFPKLSAESLNANPLVLRDPFAKNEIAVHSFKTNSPVVLISNPAARFKDTAGDGKHDDDKIDFNAVAKSIGQELKNEQNDLKRLAAQRMQEYAASHQDQLVGRMLAGPTQGASMKDFIIAYGFQKENIRRMYFRKDGERELFTVEFFSPKVNADIPISVELAPMSPSDLISQYKVARLYDLKDTMRRLGEDTDAQVQELVRYSLQDIAPQAAADRTRSLINRLTKSEGAKKLLEKLKGRL